MTRIALVQIVSKTNKQQVKWTPKGFIILGKARDGGYRKEIGSHCFFLGDRPWWTQIQAIHKGIAGSEWAELYFHYRAMSKAAGAKKLSQSQKAKALWAMKAAKDRREEFYDPSR